MENNNTALNGVKMMIADGIVTQEAAEKYFPELKKSKDERTQLTEFLWDLIYRGSSFRYHREDFERWKDWLEKQGEQKPDDKAKRYDDLLVKLQEAKVNNDVCDERYCCVIDDIVPELKGSEDEKIRNALIRFHKSTIDVDGIKGENIIAWLERQGETFTKKDVDDAYVEGMALAKHELEKQGEQKADESRGMNLVEEKMTPFQREVFGIIDLDIENEQGLKQVCDKLLTLASNEIKRKSAEWSDEDEEYLRRAINAMKDTHPKTTDWLKSLKERVACEANCTTTKQWKPSEEQIKELEFFIFEFPKCSVTAQKIIKKGKDTLVSLLSDLKKLREE